MLGNTYPHMACLPKQCIPSHNRAQCSLRGHAGHAFAQNMEEPLIEQVSKVRCGSGLKPWYPEHKVVNDKIFIKLCKWDRSFTAFILGRSTGNRKGSGPLYFLEGLFKTSLKNVSQPMYMILFNYSTPSYLNPVRNQHYNININTKSFDKMVQDRKEQSGKVAMEELSMEGDGEKPSKNEENPGV